MEKFNVYVTLELIVFLEQQMDPSVPSQEIDMYTHNDSLMAE